LTEDKRDLNIVFIEEIPAFGFIFIELWPHEKPGEYIECTRMLTSERGYQICICEA
jgi:hypothetical protein